MTIYDGDYFYRGIVMKKKLKNTSDIEIDVQIVEPENLRTTILNGNCEENCLKLLTPTHFSGFLHQIIGTNCDESKLKRYPNQKCISPQTYHPFINSLLDSFLTQHQLSNIFDFFENYLSLKIANKQSLPSSDINNLISLAAHYTMMHENKIASSEDTFSVNDVKTISSFFNFLTHLLSIQNIKNFSAPKLIHHGTLIKDLLPKITSNRSQTISTLIGDSNKLIEKLTETLSRHKSSIEEENLLTLLRSLFKFTFRLNEIEFNSMSRTSQIAIKKIFTSSVIHDKETVAWSFLTQYRYNHAFEVKKACNQLLAINNCYPPKTKLFSTIISGNYTLTKPSLKDYEEVKAEIFWSINNETMPYTEYKHLFLFLKNYLKNNTELSNKIDFSDLYKFISYHINNLNKTNIDKTDFDPILDNLSFLLFKTMKENKGQNSYEAMDVINSYKQLYGNIIKATSLTPLLKKLNKHLFSLLKDNINQNNAITADSYIIVLIKNLIGVCQKNPNRCNTYKLSSNLFNHLGALSRQSNQTHLNVITTTNTFIESAKNYLTPDQLNKAVSSFFSPAMDQAELNNRCKEYFNLTGCRPRKSDNLTLFTRNADPVSLTDSPISENTITAFNFPSTAKVGASVAHGFVSGLLNIMSQTIPLYLHRNNYVNSKTADCFLHLTLATIQAAGIASFPLMLLTLNELVAEGREDEAQARWEMMKNEVLPTFFTSLGLSTGLLLLNNISKKYLPKSSIVKGLIHSVPTVSSLWSLSQNPILTGIHVGTSYAVSLIGITTFNRFFSARSQQLDVETNLHNMAEMEVLNNKNPIKPTNATTPLESELTEKSHQYICLPELNEIKRLSQGALDRLSKLIETLKRDIRAQQEQIRLTTTPRILNECKEILKHNIHILEEIESRFYLTKTLHEELTSDIHLNACEMYTEKQQALFFSAMEKLGNVFKLMETNFKALENKLESAIGYKNAVADSFSNELKQQLETLKRNISFPLSKATLYKDRYSNAHAIAKTEKRCKKEANQEIFNVMIAANRNPIGMTLKRNNNASNYNNRNTVGFHRGSIDNFKTISTSSSTESEQFLASVILNGDDPSNPEQKTPLLNSNKF